ncbi:class II aldolase/adducin family protein, partial [Candidatus Entotheonella palauensis]|uniref:class II aldolase/adducin family protein n=1 Tax=Candidatus Entotheonella palauensis TaxID=93172 RepID=UPI0015C49E47
MSVTRLRPVNTSMSDAEWDTRCDLAALYRVLHKLGWTDLIFTHMSARVPGEEGHFLISNSRNPFNPRIHRAFPL